MLVSQCSPHTPIQLLLGTAATTIGLHLGLALGPISFLPHIRFAQACKRGCNLQLRFRGEGICLRAQLISRTPEVSDSKAMLFNDRRDAP